VWFFVLWVLGCWLVANGDSAKHPLPLPLMNKERCYPHAIKLEEEAWILAC
jgi:hypothetical protein